MNRYELNSQLMGESTEQTLENYKSLWTANLIFKAGVDQHTANMNTIRANATKQQNAKDITGVINDIEMLRSLMIENIIRHISGICAYAESIGDNALAESVHYTQSFLEKTGDSKFVSAASKVKDVAVANATEIKDYGVSAQMITLLTNDIVSYIDISKKPKSMRSEQKNITANLKKAVVDMKEFLKNTMDRLVKANFLASDFANVYFNSRKVYNLGQSGTILRGTVLDINGHPIKNCAVELVNYPTPGTNTIRITNNKGHYAYKRLGLEVATLRFRAVNYAVAEFEVKLVKDKENDFDAKLTPIPAAVPVFV